VTVKRSVFLALAAALAAISCRGGAPVLRRQSRLMMDTYVTVTAYAPAAKADKALARVFDRLEEISRKFNHLDTTSPLYAFNTRNQPLVDPEVIEVMKAAQSISAASGGAFDVTVEPLVRLWGFYSGHPALPSLAGIDSCLKQVGYQNLIIEPNRVTKLNPNTTVDLGGIAKGYALKEAARVLRSEGVDSAVIDAGGDVYAIGKKGNQNWKVGIRNPRGEGVLGVAAVSNLAVVTSGDYERYFFGPDPNGTATGSRGRKPDGSPSTDSVRYCHIINPKTGWPARGFASTTVIMRDPLAAQGWSKVLFILGPDALGLADTTDGFEALLITDRMKAIMSKGLAALLDLKLPEAGLDTARGR
jgi:thiamine biosynthesis lipoprotein